MKKMLWSEPQLTEIEIKMTETGNKIGCDWDIHTDDTDLTGTITPCVGCS